MKKTKRFLSAALAAAVFGSVSAYVATAATAASKVPEGYHGLALTANGNGDIYGVTMTKDQLKALPYSEADSSAGRNDPGYYAGFYVDALNTGANGGTASYARAYTYVADLDDATIKSLTYGAGTSTDGQFWPRFIKSHLSPTGRDSTPYLVYAIKATYDNDASNPMYYYIAVDWKSLPEDFAFDDSENCAGTHSPSTPCNICGNTADVTYKSVSNDYPANFTGERLDAAEEIGYTAEIKDNEVVVTFTKTKDEIKKIVQDNPYLNAGARGSVSVGGSTDGAADVQGVDPVYLDIETNIPTTLTAANFNFTSGYGWDDENNKAFNFDQGHIKLWLKAGKVKDEITYTVSNSEAQTLTIKYEYASATKPTTKPTTTTTKPSTTTTKPAANPTKNPPTGIALATAPAVLAAGAVIVAAKKRK